MKKWIDKQKETQEELDVMMAYMYDGIIVDTIQQLVNPFEEEEGASYHGLSRLLTEQEFNVLLETLHESFQEVPVKFVFISTRLDFIKKCFYLHYTCRRNLHALIKREAIQEFTDSYQHYMYFHEFNLPKLPKHQVKGFLILYILVKLYLVKHHHAMTREKLERKATLFAIRMTPKVIEEFIKRI